MTTLYTVERKERLPMRLNWLVKYVKYLGVHPHTLQQVPLQNLTIALFFIILFLSISRPAELLFTDSTEDELIEIITTGLKWKDLSFHDLYKHKTQHYIQFTVHWFKNQTARGKPKIIDMQSPLCTNKRCKCSHLDFIAMLQALKQRRIAFRDRLEALRATQNGFLTTAQRKQYNNLGTSPNDYIFVGEDGKVWAPPHARQIMKQFQAVIGMNNPTAYPLYCMRIGAMSLVNQQRMDLLKALRYVAWAVPKLPHVQHRYINFRPEELRLVPFEMIHGAMDEHGISRDYSHTKLTSFDLASAKDMIFDLKKR